MNCSSCSHDNRPSAKFCEECAAPLARTCASCAAELRPTAKFCDECAAPTGVPHAAATQQQIPSSETDSRKVVTIVFADLVGSTALHERLDPESAGRFMESYYVAMRGAVDGQGGTVTQLLGDGVKAVFGMPRVAEDDAIRAVRAAVEMQRAFRILEEQQMGAVGKTGLRVAVNTGEVVANDATEIIGDPVNVAARLQEQGRDGDVVIGDSTQQLVAALVTTEPLGSFALKGRSVEVSAYRVVSLDPPAAAAAAPFLGRDAELAALTKVYEIAVDRPATCLAVLLGSPGLGKSRLIDELSRRFAETAVILTAHCDAAGGETFAPLAEALREHLGLDDAANRESVSAALAEAIDGTDAERVRIREGIGSLLAGSPASPEETFFVIRKMLAVLAETRPVVLFLDDLQWAAPLLLDLVEHLVQWGSDVPVFILVGARPELRESRSSLATPGGLVTDVITLAGLDAGAAMQLAANVIGAADLPAAVAAKVLAASEGNPLFVGELVRMLVHEGALQKEGDRWTTGVALEALEMPATIHALLAARIERLEPQERAVLERAAVVGRSFSRGAVEELLPSGLVDLDARLESLRRSELIESDTGWFLGEPALRFHHVLIRDAAYRRILKGTRAELHAHVANWIESTVPVASDHDETLGWHLEQAHQNLSELGPIDENGRTLGERAARHLAAAGRRALTRDDVPLAASLLRRALDRLSPDAPQRADLALDVCEALLSAGDMIAAATTIAEFDRLADGSERLRAWHTCYACELSILTAPEDLRATTESVAAAAEKLAELDDAAGEAKAHSVHADALARLGRVGDAEVALDRALSAARRAGDPRRVNAVLAGAPLASLSGPSPVTRASGRCLDVVRVLRITQGAPGVEAVALSCQGVLEALRGRTEAARRMLDSSRKMVEELGITRRLLEVDVFVARIDLIEGDALAAERNLRRAYEGLTELGLGIDAARAGALLARALLAQDQAAEAETLSHECEALAGDDLPAAIAWRCVRAEALARRGEHAKAVAFAEAAVAIADATDGLLDHADARLSLAAALASAGRHAAADAEERRAIELWDAKGASLMADRARRDRAPREAPTLPDAHAVPVSGERRPVRSNIATATQERFDSWVAARDFDALRSQYRDDYQGIDHSLGATWGTDASIASLERLMRAQEPSFRMEPIATLGDYLALFRRATGASGTGGRRFDVGEYEHEALHLIAVDEQSLLFSAEVFPADGLGSALAAIYQRYAELLPAGPERELAAASAVALEAFIGPIELDRMRRAFAPNYQQIDHRSLATWSANGADEVLEQFRALSEVASGQHVRVEELLALQPNAVLSRRTHAGIYEQSGGEYERLFLQVLVTDSGGRLALCEFFDADRESEAFARFDAVTTGRSTSIPARRLRANLATENAERNRAAFVARDLDALRATLSDEMTIVYHPTGSEYGVEEAMASFQWLFETRETTYAQETLAALGDSLAIVRSTVSTDGTADDSAGPTMAVNFTVYEVDEHGLTIHGEIFAEDRLDKAIACLYARESAHMLEGPERIRAAAIASRFNSDAVGETVIGLDPEIEFFDHRIVGVGLLRGHEAVVEATRAFEDLTEEMAISIADVLALTEEAQLMRVRTVGRMRDGGGAFEREFFGLRRFGLDGLIANLERFEIGREHEAHARFEELSRVGEPDAVPQGGWPREALEPARAHSGKHFGEATSGATPRERFSNTASRAHDDVMQAWRTRDMERWEQLHPPQMRYVDHRRLFQLELDRDEFAEFAKPLLEMRDANYSVELLATRGERLALRQLKMEVADDTVGPSEIDSLLLTETDERGEIATYVRYDKEDLDAAHVELDARWDAGEGAEHPLALAWSQIGAKEFERSPSWVSPDFICENRRLTGFGTLHGRAEFAAAQREMFVLAPDARVRVAHTRLCALGGLTEFAWIGTRDGGAFESSAVSVFEIDEHGIGQRIDIWDLHDFDAAQTRFVEVEARTSRDPLAVITKPNAASLWIERFKQAFNKDPLDWDEMRSLYKPGLEYEDRQRLFLISGDLEMLLSSLRQRKAAGAQIESIELLGTAGDHVVVHRTTWGGGGTEARFETEFIVVQEVDETGRLVANVNFDSDNRDAAQREARARWAAIEPEVAEPVAVLAKLTDAFNTRDLAGIRSAFSDDLTVDDHRLAGMGRIDDADVYANSIAVLWELASDIRVEYGWFWPAVRSDGGITLLQRFGHAQDGGAFESDCLYLILVADGLVTHAELFEVDELDAALARFEELRPGSLVIPSNAATRNSDLRCEYGAAENWDALRAMYADDVLYDDRRPIVRLKGNKKTLSGDLEYMFGEAQARVERSVLATGGDRIALERWSWTARDDEQPYELDVLVVIEVDTAALVRTVMLFSPDDRAAAGDEFFERYTKNCSLPASFAQYVRAWNDHDLERLRSLMPEFIHDRRRTGVGRLDPEAYLDSLRALFELSSDVRIEPLYQIKMTEHAMLSVNHWFGTNAEGGEFEAVYTALMQIDDERILRLELFEPEDLETANARFEEITSD